MQTVFMVFMIFVSLMCTFSVLVVVRDIIKEIVAAHKESRKESQKTAPAPASEEAGVAAPVAPVAAQEAAVEAPVAAPVAEEAVVAEEVPAAEEAAEEVAPVEEAAEEAAEEATEEEDPDKISFSKGVSQTLEEKYLALTPEQKSWYDAIIKHAANVEGAKRVKNTRYEEYKVGQARLVRLLIKRGIVFCELYLQNNHFKNLVNENKLSVKQTATIVRVVDEASKQAVLDGVDIAVLAIAEEKEYKKQLAREKRRAKRQAEAEAEAATADEANA